MVAGLAAVLAVGLAATIFTSPSSSSEEESESSEESAKTAFLEESLSSLSLPSLESDDSTFFAFARASLDAFVESSSLLISRDPAVFTAVPLTGFTAGASDSSESEESEESSDEEAFLTARFLAKTVCVASSESESEDSDDSGGAAFFVG